MKKEKEEVYFIQLGEMLKNPPRDKYVLVYTKRNSEDEPVKKHRERATLKQVINRMNAGFKRMDAKIDAGFKQVNTRLDYIVSANKLKDLPKSKR